MTFPFAHAGRLPIAWPSARLVCLIAGLACGTALAQPAAQTTSRGQQPTEAGAPRQDRSLARADRQFMEQAAQNNQSEVETGRLALQKAVHPEVRAFARQMVEDHTRTGAELRALAHSLGVDLPDRPSLLQQAQFKLLDAFDGADFDRRYTERIGLIAHRETIELFQGAARTSRDPQVRAFAAKTLPALQHHLKMAERLPDAQGTARAGASARR